MTTDAPAPADLAAKPSVSSRFNVGMILREPLLGPLVALVIAIIIFSSVSDSFLNPQNVSLILQQSVVVGILAVGQTLIILTSGIDLSIGAVAVLGTIVMAQSAGANGPVVALGSTLLVCVVFGAVNGGGGPAPGLAAVHRPFGNVPRDTGGPPPARGLRDLPRGGRTAHLP